jgi:uncharacterized protein involved in exopolysaccharide biosynthesis
MRSKTEVIRPKQQQEAICAPRRSELPGLRDNADALFRMRRTVAAVCGIFTLALAVWVWGRSASYEAQMTILVKNSRPDLIITPDGAATPILNGEVNDSQMGTEVQLLSSADLFRKVVDQCGLGGNTPASRDRAVEKLQKKVRIAPLMKSSMIRVRYASPDPQLSARVLQALADAYLERHLQLHSSTGSLALFEQQAGAYEKKLRDAEYRLIEFQKHSGIVGAPQQKEMLIRKVIDQQSALREAQANSIDTQKRISALRSQLTDESPRITTQTRKLPNQYSVERLNTLIAELRNKRTDLLTKFRPGDRMIKEVEQQIADTQAALDNAQKLNSYEVSTDVNPLRQNIQLELSHAEASGDGLRGRIDELRSQTQAYRSELEKLGGILPDEQELLREIKVAEDNFLLYSRKREEARIGEVMDQQKIGNVAVAEAPRVPALSEPRLTAGVGAAFLFGNLLILLAALILGHARRTVYTPWELEAFTGLPVLATASFCPSGQSDILLHRKGNAA